MPTMGWLRCVPPAEPKKPALPKVKMPPSAATNRYPVAWRGGGAGEGDGGGDGGGDGDGGGESGGGKVTSPAAVPQQQGLAALEVANSPARKTLPALVGSTAAAE